MRMTKQRKLIYDILKAINKPLNIENIFYSLPDETMNLSTVYRTIEYFESFDLLIKFHFNGNSYYILNDNNEHHHFSICTSCLEMKEIACHLDQTIKDLKNDDSFLVTNHEITIYGLCKDCQ